MAVMRRGDDRPTVVDAFLAGNELALAEIYARWSPLVYSIALGSLGNVADAESVTQRVFTAAWTSRQTFDSTRTQLSAWLIAITLSRIAEAQKAGNEPSEPEAQVAMVTQPDGTVAPAELAEQLVLIDEVSHLDPVPQQVLRMALHQELTHAQIAEHTGLPPATVKGHLRRSLLNLRARLEVRADAY